MPYEAAKTCPFCDERIAADAIKCRYCREFLEDGDGLPVSHHAPRGFGRNLLRTDMANAEDNEDDSGYFAISPSLWGLLGFYFTAAMFMAVAVFLLFYPVEELLQNLTTAPLDKSILFQIERATGYAGLAIGLLTLLLIVLRTAELKSIYYEISPDRVEYGRGIFSRKIDNLDMFRVVDLKLHRSLLDCILGVGSVALVTKDNSDPLFEFEKVADPKQLYDVLKKASLDADRKQGVVHLD